MKRVVVLAALAACWRSAAPSARPAPAPAPSLAGAYRAVESMLVCEPSPGSDCEETWDDTMILRELPGGALHATIELVKPVEHICRFDGDLVSTGDHRWSFTDGACRVDLVHRVDVVELTSDGCRTCEAPAVMEATFAYPPRRPRD